jgi:hypothetical protein
VKGAVAEQQIVDLIKDQPQKTGGSPRRHRARSTRRPSG